MNHPQNVGSIIQYVLALLSILCCGLDLSLMMFGASLNGKEDHAFHKDEIKKIEDHDNKLLKS